MAITLADKNFKIRSTKSEKKQILKFHEILINLNYELVNEVDGVTVAMTYDTHGDIGLETPFIDSKFEIKR